MPFISSLLPYRMLHHSDVTVPVIHIGNPFPESNITVWPTVHITQKEIHIKSRIAIHNPEFNTTLEINEITQFELQRDITYPLTMNTEANRSFLSELYLIHQSYIFFVLTERARRLPLTYEKFLKVYNTYTLEEIYNNLDILKRVEQI